MVTRFGRCESSVDAVWLRRWTGFDFVDEALCFRVVVRDDAGRQAVIDVVCGLEAFLEVLDFDDSEDWSEDFLLCDAEVVFNIAEDGWLDVVALTEALALWLAAASLERCAFVLCDVDIIEGALEFAFGYLRAHVVLVAGDLQGRTEETVEATEQTNDSVTSANDGIDEAISNLEEIAEAVDEAALGITQIAEANDDQAASVEEVASEADGVATDADQIEARIAEVTSRTNAQRDAVEEMVEYVEQLNTDQRVDGIEEQQRP